MNAVAEPVFSGRQVHESVWGAVWKRMPPCDRTSLARTHSLDELPPAYRSKPVKILIEQSFLKCKTQKGSTCEVLPLGRAL
ncbi:hypothetical protein [Pseudomonas syringae]|uniref:hypothetical protein n=1 Tax=Pseudomonas syringae TaxID=317 RepID=UPI00177EFB6A|nr:hypothetical protein [Pseudomonas syringae]